MQFAIEDLESRRHLSAAPHGHSDHPAPSHGHHAPATTLPKNAVKVAGRNLIIQGTKNADTISVTTNAANPTKLDVTYNGVTVTVSAGKLKRIQVNAKGGDDSVTIDPSVHLNAQLIGGGGNDSLTGGSGNDTLNGGDGTNQLTGGAGADRFVANSAAEVTDLTDADHDTLKLPDTTSPDSPDTTNPNTDSTNTT